MTISGKLAWSGVVAAFLAVLGTGAASAKEGAARPVVGHGPGVLAVRDAAGQAWKMADEGTVLPMSCQLRTASVGPCCLSLPGSSLILDSDARLTLTTDEHSLAVEAGRIQVETKPDQSWTATLGSCHAALQGDTKAELHFGRDRMGTVTVLRGTATITRGEEPATELTAGRVAMWGSANDKPIETRELPEDKEEEIGQWANLATTPQGLGQLVVEDSQAGSRQRLNVARYHVNVVLQPPVALVQIDQSFYNPFNRQQEGTFVFNLPPGASVSRFAMYVTHEKLVEGEVIDRDRGREIYQTIVDRKRDPAILEQIGDNLFRMRVFPIPANDTKRILLDYTIPLTAQHGEYQFRLPLLSDLEPIWDFQLIGSILGPTREGSIRSSSHPELAFARRGDNSFGFEMEANLFQPDRDFTVSFCQEEDEEVRLQSYLAPPLPTPNWVVDGGDADPWSGRAATYFMATIPPEETAESSPSPPADVLLLADTSSGMRGATTVTGAVRTVLHNLGPKDRLRLMAVDVAARPIHDGWVAGGSEDLEGVLEAFQQEFCLGGTDLATSFQQAFESFPQGEDVRRRVMIYVGDGDDSDLTSISARMSAKDLARKLARAGVTFVGINARRTPGGPATLDCLAKESGGLVFDLTAGRAGHRGLLDWLLAGLPSPERIVHLEVEGAAAEDVLVPSAWMPGQPLVVLGRTAWTDRLCLKLATSRGDKPLVRQWNLKVERDADDVFVGRLWAQKKLAELCHYTSVARAAMLHDRIVALSQEWSVLTPHTAFLVLEGEEDYLRWKVDRRARRRYWKPAEALPTEPLPRAWLARVAPDDSLRKQELEAKRLARAMATARDAMEHKNYSLAQGVLQNVARLAAAKASDQFARLLQQAMVQANRESVLKNLGPQRGLFDPAERGQWLPDQPRLAPLLTQSLGVGAEFLSHHPYARDLLVEISVRSRQGRHDGFNVQELAELIRAATSANVVVDVRALEDISMSPQDGLDLYGVGRMSVRNYVRFVLDQADLAIVEEPNRILITTPEEAEIRLRTEVYPVADLYLKDHPIRLESLSNPYLDCDEAAKRRIESKLDRPISVDFEKTPLDQAMAHLAQELDDTVLIDHEGLDDVALDPRSPVTAHWKNVPARQALRWLLDQLDLDYYVAGEALVVTTPEERELHLETRLHSGRGIVFEYEVPKGQSSPPPWYRDHYYGWDGGYMGGYMGGMGGMGAMGAGGLGGMGGMMGGGGGGGGFGSGNAGGVDLVLGTDPSAPQKEAPDDSGEKKPDVAVPETKPAEAESKKQFVLDVESVIEQVTSTVDPETWEDVGGPGSLAFFTPTLDFVARQEDSAHRQIDALFTTLRNLPTLWKGSDLRKATPETVDAGDASGVDFDELITMITSTVNPYDWEDVGGPGSITPDVPRLALIVRATQEVHDDLGRVLTMLRRSRYAIDHGEQPWEMLAEQVAGGQALNRLLGDGDAARLPEPAPGELECLKVRSEPGEGLWKWRCEEGEKTDARTLEIRRRDDRMEIDQAGSTFRVAGDEAAVRYDGLLLVEFGRWGEGVRQLADAWLPWMPHRTNRELARAFQVKRLEKQDEKHPDWVFLEFLPNGSGEKSGVRIEAAFSSQDGGLRRWRCYEDDQPIAQIRFVADPAKQVILEDASGKQLARWELVGHDSQCPAIADLTNGWDGCVQWDRRTAQPVVDKAFPKALAAIRGFDWAQASTSLEECLKTHPKHPLLELLLAWRRARQPESPAQVEIPDALGRVAASGATGLVRFIDRNNFPSLDARQFYDILVQQPEATREAFDLDRLAKAAVEAGWWEKALGHVQAALALETSDGRQFERTRMLVEVLLRLDRVEEALKVVDGWDKASKQPVEQLAAMGEILARAGQGEESDKLFAEALRRDDLETHRRYDLLVRSANLQGDVPRWEALLEAAALQPSGSEARGRCLNQVLKELSWPPAMAKVAAKLASEVEDPEIQARLKIQQTDLTEKPAAAAEIAWGIFQAGQLPDGRLWWLCRLCRKANREDLIIKAAEARLRLDRPLPNMVLRYLEEAYTSLGRKTDALRAATGEE